MPALAQARRNGRAPGQSAGPTRAQAPSRARWQALGTSAELLVLGDERELTLARTAVERWLDQVDRACSRFRADSDLNRVNAAGGHAVRVSPTLVEATELGLRAALITDGDVDPTLGKALELAGYDRDWALIEADPSHGSQVTPRPRVRVRMRPGWRGVRVDPARATIELPRGVKLDLGATAKAWAADCAARAASAASGCGVLVSLGGDIATSGECPRAGWRVHVTDNHRDGPEAPGQTIAIRSGGLATSSTFVRRWRLADRRSRRVGWAGLQLVCRSPIGGEQMHHIIDPATGAPADTPWRTVSVAAETCAEANIAATAAIVRGKRAVRWLAQAGLPARLVANDGEVLAIGSWPLDSRRAAGEADR